MPKQASCLLRRQSRRLVYFGAEVGIFSLAEALKNRYDSTLPLTFPCNLCFLGLFFKSINHSFFFSLSLSLFLSVPLSVSLTHFPLSLTSSLSLSISHPFSLSLSLALSFSLTHSLTSSQSLSHATFHNLIVLKL